MAITRCAARTSADFSAGADDFIQYDDTVFANFDTVMAAATQAGNDVLITLERRELDPAEVLLGNLHGNDFQFT